MSGNKRHKLLFINHWAERLGGAELSLLDLMIEAVKRADIFLVCSEDGTLVEKAKKAGVKCKIIPCDKNVEKLRRDHLFLEIFRNWRSVLSYFRFIWQLQKYVTELKPDIIHTNVPKSHVAASLLAKSGYRGILVYHIREIFHKRSFTSMLYGMLLPRRGARIIAISNAVKNSLPKRVKKQTTILYNGIDVPVKPHGKITGEKLRFLYLGRIVPWKGCHLIIDAFFRMYQQSGDNSALLDLIGDTLYWDQSYRNNLTKKIIQLNMTDKIKILPHTEKSYEMYHSHDVLCMASDNEPFGRVAIEAMSYGLPVISFDSGGISEIIEHNSTGLLVMQNDIKNYAAAMEIFEKNRHLVKCMGNAGYKLIKSKFNLKKNVPDILDFILN